jgi:hypothetical protein
MTPPKGVSRPTANVPTSAQRQVSFHLPCAFDGRECNVEAIGRVHDADDQGVASAYVCPDHIGWGFAWVESFTDKPARFTRFASSDSGSSEDNREDPTD